TSAKQTGCAVALRRISGRRIIVFDHFEELVGIRTARAAENFIALGVLDDLHERDTERDALAVFLVLPGVGIDDGDHFGAGTNIVLLEDRVALAVKDLGLE